MSSRNVQRSVKVQRHERSAGDAPAIGRVSRMRGMAGKAEGKGEWKRKKRSDGRIGMRPKEKSEVKGKGMGTAALTWSVLLMVGTLGVLIGFFGLWLKSNMGRGAGASERSKRLVVEEGLGVARIALPKEEAVALVKRALAVREADEVAEHFRLDGRSAEEVVAFLEGMEELDGEMGEFRWIGSMNANDLELDGVLLHAMKEGMTTYRLAVFVADAAGGRKIDFDALARTVDPSWELFLDRSVDEAVVRVVMVPDSYFNGVFLDESEWICFSLGSPELEKKLYGYCKRGSAQAAALSRVFRGDGSGTGAAVQLKRMTLGIRQVEGAKSGQVEIIRVLAEDWVLSDKPFDEKFR